MAAQTRRIVRDRQRIALDTRAGRECQLKEMVPIASTTRCVVITYNGGSVNMNQTGEISNMRMKSAVSAGRVVAEVAVR